MERIKLIEALIRSVLDSSRANMDLEIPSKSTNKYVLLYHVMNEKETRFVLYTNP